MLKVWLRERLVLVVAWLKVARALHCRRTHLYQDRCAWSLSRTDGSVSSPMTFQIMAMLRKENEYGSK